MNKTDRVIDKVGELITTAMLGKGYKLTETDVGYNGDDLSYFNVNGEIVVVTLSKVER